MKADERLNNGDPEKGMLGGVPLALPALIQAQEYQDRAARVGFDWPEIEGVLEKIAEEIQEVRDAADEGQLADELGDLFFALVNLARWKKIDAEAALRGTNTRFRKRFDYVEAGAKKQARQMSDLTLNEMEALWHEAKTVSDPNRIAARFPRKSCEGFHEFLPTRARRILGHLNFRFIPHPSSCLVLIIMLK